MKTRSWINSVLNNKCPQCRTGDLYKSKWWQINKLLSMYTHCPNCGLKYEREIGFWWGTAYINYALSVLFGGIYAIFFGITYGFSVYDDSVYIFLISVISTLIFLQPIIMRFGRTLYLSFFIRYKPKEKEDK